MATHQSAKDACQEYIDTMGEPLGILFHALWQELAWLYWKWNEYLALYGTKPSRIDLINKAAPGFFRVIQDSLWEDTILHLARLTDPPSSGGKPNLTIRRLKELINDDATSKAVASLTVKAIEATEFCRDWRNRRIAHRDLSLALSQGAEPLKAASREKVRAALSAVADVLNAVTQHYRDSTTHFDCGAGSGGAYSLLYCIADGINAEKKRREKLSRGEFDINDNGPRDL